LVRGPRLRWSSEPLGALFDHSNWVLWSFGLGTYARGLLSALYETKPLGVLSFGGREAFGCLLRNIAFEYFELRWKR
jgi:hypothetical protein